MKKLSTPIEYNNGRKHINRIDLICIVLFLASLFIRLLKMILDPVLLRDSAQYLNMAETWKNTGSYAEAIEVGTPVPPLPVFMIKSLAATGFSEEMAGRGLAIFLGSSIPVIGFTIVYLVCKRYKIALIAALLLMFNPVLVSISTQPMRENNYLFFQGIMICFLIKSIQQRGISYLILCGILCSISICCRYEAIEFLFLSPIVFFFVYHYRKISLKRFVISTTFFSMSLVLSLIFITFFTDSGMVFVTKIPNYLAPPTR